MKPLDLTPTLNYKEQIKCTKIITDLHRELAEFINQERCSNVWLTVTGARIYVRKGKRYINSILVDTFEIGSISIDEAYQNKGILKAFLESVFNLNKNSNRIIYVESVLNNVLSSYLERNSWTSINLDCYYLANPYKTN